MHARRTSRPQKVTVWYRGVRYTLNLAHCRRALVERHVAGEVHGIESLARAVGISRSTVSRFFSGQQASLTVTLRILAVLRLTFDEVAWPYTDDQDDSEGTSPAGSGSPLLPRSPLPDAGSFASLAHATNGQAARSEPGM